jgi:Fur family ferric uptake transcriptional regulator
MIRKTRQSKIIREVLESARRPLSPREIQERALEDVPSLGIATVYRALNTLSEEGSIRPVQVPGKPARYEVTGKGHHHHFCCRECERIFDMPGCVHAVEDLAPEGFVTEAHEILLYGVCQECHQQNGR